MQNKYVEIQDIKCHFMRIYCIELQMPLCEQKI